MLEWIAGTLAWTYLKNKVSDKAASKAEDFAFEQGGKFFRKLTDQFKESVPADNEQLARAFHRSYLIATRQICDRLNKNLGNDNLPSSTSNLRSRLLGKVPTSIFGQSEKDWIDKAKTHLQKELGKLENDQTYLIKRPSDEYQKTILSNEIGDSEIEREFQNLFTENAIDELKKAIRDDPPETFVAEMRKNWLDLVGNDFLTSISADSTLNNIFQNKTLAKLELDNNVIRIQLGDFLNLLPEIIRLDGDKTRDRLEKVGNKVDSLEEELKKFRKKANEPILPNTIPSIGNFVGREDYLRELHKSYENGDRCFVLNGIGGVGKTAMALQFAGEIAENYAAKIFVDMQGMSENPISPRDALFDIVVRQFKHEVPADTPDAQLKSVFVQLSQSQPTLIVLDNAKDKESVETFTKVKACLIVTSRQSFVLTGGKSAKVGKMSPEDARILLFEIAGENRFEGRADELAGLAGYLPMALKPLASLLADDELETAEDLIEKYRNKQELLKERVPDYEDLTVEASFELSYEKLSDKIKALWRRLSVFPSDFDEAAIEAVLNISADEAKETQKQLRKFSLLEVNPETIRFNLHDLIRAFADSKLFDDERFNIQFLHAKYYASILEVAADIKSKDRKNGFINALKLIDTEWGNITTAQKWTVNFTEKNNDIAELCFRYAVDFLVSLRLHPRENIVWLEASLIAARKLNNKTYEGKTLGNLGDSFNDLGEYRKAIKYHERALKIARGLKNQYGESACLSGLGLTYDRLGDYQKSVEYFEQSLAISRKIGDQSGEGESLFRLAMSYNHLNEPQKAIEYSQNSLKIRRKIRDQFGESKSLLELGNGYDGLKEYQKAKKYYDKSLRLSRKIGDRLGEGVSLGNLGNVYVCLGEYRKAIEYHEQFLKISREKGDRLREGGGLGSLGIAYYSLGEKEKACGLWKEAVTIFEAIESPRADYYRRILEKFCENRIRQGK